MMMLKVRDNLVLAVQRQRLIREGKLRAVVREGRRARVPLDTLKKEERRGKEEEKEEEVEEERRRTIRRRERGRGKSIVRSEDNHLIRRIVTETPPLSEVSDVNSFSPPVTEPSVVVEASTVVNYEKKELAELLESKEVSPGLVLVNYRPAMVKRRKVVGKKASGLRRRVRVKARQKSTEATSKFSPTTTTRTPSTTITTTTTTTTTTTRPSRFREMRFPVRPLPSPAGTPLGSQGRPLTQPTSIFGSPNLPSPFKFSSFDDFAEFDAQFGGAVPPSPTSTASPATTAHPVPFRELPRRILFGNRAQRVPLESKKNVPIVKEETQQLFPSRQRNFFPDQSGLLGRERQRQESPRSSLSTPRASRPLTPIVNQQQSSLPTTRSRGLPRRLLFGARAASPSPPQPSSSTLPLPSPTSSLSSFGPTFSQQAPSLPENFFSAPSNSLAETPSFSGQEPPPSPPTSPTSSFILHPASTTNQQPTTSFINIRTGSYTINTSL